jgi:hypothetical protein
VNRGGHRAHTPGSAANRSDRMEEEYHFDPESTVLRRADADDCDAIINLVEIGEDDIYNRVYSYPKILKLIETAYLAITVIDKNTGSIVGFAAFEDFPQVSLQSRSLNARSAHESPRTLPALAVEGLYCASKCNGSTQKPSGAPSTVWSSTLRKFLTFNVIVGLARYDRR